MGYGDYCDESTWSDVDGGTVCGDCYVLATNMDTYETCFNYCSAQGLGCIDAWEENSDTCEQEWHAGCDYDFAEYGTSDALCHCTGNPNDYSCADASTGACTEGGGYDDDCCASCGNGGCASGYTYAGQINGLQGDHPDWYQSCDVYCGNTCCVPDEDDCSGDDSKCSSSGGDCCACDASIGMTGCGFDEAATCTDGYVAIPNGDGSDCMYSCYPPGCSDDDGGGYSQYNCPPEFTDCGTFCDYDSDCIGDHNCGDGSWDLCGDDYVNGTCGLRNALRKALSTLAESNSTPALLPSYRTHRVLLLYDMRRRVLMR